MPPTIETTMQLRLPEPGASSPASIIPQPLRGGAWTPVRLLGPLISLVVLIAVAFRLREMDFGSVIALVPRSPVFWMIFVAYYCAGPVSEWVIFRRLWRLPASGVAALLRKLVTNELLLGYLGEVHFYAWVRRHAHVAAAPFGAIKDVTILSALVGNVFTLALVLATAPLLPPSILGVNAQPFIWSAVVVLVSSLAVFGFRRRLFSLPMRELRFVAAVHAVRVVVSIALAAFLWHLLLPTVPLLWWCILASVRQLLSRLPLLPNKDLVFAGVASLIVGTGTNIADAVTLVAGLIVATHVMVGVTLGAAELSRLVRG